MRIGVYAICKNEASLIKRCVDSINEADDITFLDTGSTDDTKEKLKECGVNVYDELATFGEQPPNRIPSIKWRYDVARNRALQMVPKDIDVCLSLDVDEICAPGWRKAIEECWKPGTTRLRYKYVWSHSQDGSPDVMFMSEKIHSRYDYVWCHPVHEVLHYVGPAEEKFAQCACRIDHWPVKKDYRSNYLPLMELGVMERPDDVRLAHYLGREYYFHKKYDEAIIELKRHLSLPNAWWEAERASSMRYIALCHKARNERHEECRWLMRACAEAPNERDSWAALSNHYTIHKNWSGGYFAALQALSIKERPMHYITSALVWGMFVHDLAGTNAYYLDLKAESKKHYEDALNFDPNNERLKNNLRIIGKI